MSFNDLKIIEQHLTFGRYQTV